jgi:hypothetical protein
MFKVIFKKLIVTCNFSRNCDIVICGSLLVLNTKCGHILSNFQLCALSIFLLEKFVKIWNVKTKKKNILS